MSNPIATKRYGFMLVSPAVSLDVCVLVTVKHRVKYVNNLTQTNFAQESDRVET